MSRAFRRLAAFCAVLALVAIACRDRGITGPGLPQAVRLTLAPRFQVGTESAQPITRIRAAVRRVDGEGDVLDEEALAEFDETVEPDDERWTVPLDFAVVAPVRVIVELELLYVGGGRPTTVEWAARAGPFVVTPGSNRTLDDLPLGRGPLPNLDVESVIIGEAPSQASVGELTALSASLFPELAGTQVFWGTLDPGIASIDYYGNLTGIAPGTARITATAGFESDTINFIILNPVAALSFFDVAGQNQSAPVGTVVPQPIRVTAYDNGERILRGVPITFRISSGGGSLAGAGGTNGSITLVTGTDGSVTLPAWTLGNAAGGNAINVSVNGSSVTSCIRATGLAGAATSIVVSNGNAQVGVAGQALPQPLSARVLDQFGNGVTGISVTFASAQGGSFAPATSTTDGSGFVQATWTPGATAGTQTATATAAGITTPATFTATVTVPQVGFLIRESGNGQTAVVGTALPALLEVRAFTNGETAIAGAPITFTITGGGGSLAGSTTGSVTILTGANGAAQLTGWTLGTAAGANTLTASSGTATPVTFTATGIAGPAFDIVVVSGSGQSGTTGQALAQPLVARVRDQFGNSIGGSVVTFATTGGGTLAPTQATTDTSGRAQTTFTPGASSTSQTVTATAAGITTPATFTASVTLPPPAVQLALANADKVSLGATQLLNVTLPTPAPAGGTRVFVGLTTADFEVLAFINGQNLTSGDAVTIPEGQTQGTLPLFGRIEGSATLTATAPGYDVGTLVVAVELRVLGLPAALSVPYGQTASLPINIPRPAPAGGVTVTLTSSNPSRVSFASSTVFIPAGSQTGSATVNGVTPGPSTVVASAPLYTSDTLIVTTSAALLLTSTAYTLDASFPITVNVRFTSIGIAVPAPAPGIPVTVTAVNPACVSVPATVTIATGLTDAGITLAAVPGGAPLPCTTRIRVTSSTPGIVSDSANVTVNPVPPINLSSVTVGAGLQRQLSFNLSSANHGGTTVRLTSSNPNQVLLAPNATTPGSGTLDVPIGIGGSNGAYYVQVIDTARGTATVTASAPAFATGSSTITMVTPALDVSGLSTNTTSLSPDNPFTVRIGVANGQNQFLNELQGRRAGAAPLVVTVTSSDVAVGTLVTTAATGATVTSQIGVNQLQTPASVAGGGVALRPVGNGRTVVSATIPGFITTSTNGNVAVNVTTPVINVSAITVGAGLMRTMSGSLGAADHAGVTLRITSTDPTRALVSPSTATAGTDFIDIPIAAGNQSFNYVVHGVNGTIGAIPFTFAAPGFATAQATKTVLAPALDISSLSTSTTTLTPENPFVVRIGVPEAQNRFLTELQAVRTGGPAFTFTIVSDTPSVATLVTSAGVQGRTVTLTLNPGQLQTPTSVAAGGVSLRPLAAGRTRVTASAPGVSTTNPNGLVIVTVTQPGISLSSLPVGYGLQRSLNGTLLASNHGGVTVRIASADPARVLVAPNDQTPGTPFIDVPVTNGTQNFPYYVQVVEGQTGAVAVTATATGFSTGNSTITAQPAYLDISGLPANTTTLSTNSAFNVRVGVANANGQFLNELQAVRAGGTPITVNLTTSSPGVAQLLPSTTNGASATATIGIRQLQTSGLSLDPLTAGTTTINVTSNQALTTSSNGTANVTVTAPAITVSAATVGAGLMRAISFSLGAPAPTGGLVIRFTSSQPGVLLLGPSATVAGTDAIDITVAAGNNAGSFYIHGVEGQTGTPTVSARAPGFSDGTASAPVVTPAIDITGMPSSTQSTGTTDAFNVRIGIANANNQFLNELQAIRAGSPARTVTVTSSNGQVGQIVVTGGATGASVTTTLAAGQLTTPSSGNGTLAFDPIAGGTTVVSATIPGFNTTNPNGMPTVTVIQAGAVQAAAVRAAAGR